MDKPHFITTHQIDEVTALSRKFFEQFEDNKGKEFHQSKGATNYFRHKCTNYDALRKNIRVARINEDESPEVNALKTQALDLIEAEYLSLKSECWRQKDWLLGRLKAHEANRTKYGSNGDLLSVPVVDLIGSDTKASLDEATEAAEIRALKEENDDLKRELDNLRKMTFGVAYDELKRLKEENREVNGLRHLIGRYLKCLDDIHAITANALRDEITPLVKASPVHGIPSSKRENTKKGHDSILKRFKESLWEF